jgi:hypothetical protein
MNHQYPLARAAACLLLATAGVQVHAQESAVAAADPQAAVPATRYQSTIGYRPETGPDASPDRNWVASNAKVAATNSMALTMKPPTMKPPTMSSTNGQHEHAAMQGMSMPAQKQDGGDMCAPAAGEAKDGRQAGKMSCCESGCKCCKERS